MFLTNRLSIQSKLTLMLLGVCIGSILGISYLGYTDGRAALLASIYNHLGGIRVSKASMLKSVLDGLRDEVITFAEGETTRHATADFTAAYRLLATKKLDDEQEAKLTAFYDKVFLPELAKGVDGVPVLETYLPTTAVGRYLQYQFIASSPNPYQQKFGVGAPRDGTDYSAVHDKYHPVFSSLAKRFEYEDVMLIDAQTLEIVYTYQKTVEFATSLVTGPYADTNLGQAVRKVRKAMDRGDYLFADFEHYRPNLGKPSAFIASPIFDGPRMTGIFVVQFPLNEINRVMTGGRGWAKEGLGRTGEVFLVGSDHLMRSRERFYIEDRENFLRQISARGVSSKTIARIKQQEMTVLNLEVDSGAVDRALTGQEGMSLHEDFRGVPVLASYAPLEVEGERWAIIAKIDQEEAFAPIRAHGRKVLAYSVGVILAVTLLATMLAHVFTRPIRKLTEGARAVAGGQGGVVVEVDTNDEFRDLAVSFNAMTWSLQAKTELIEQQVRENEELLLNILPGPVAARMKGGDANGQLTESFADVTVLFADLDGFTELAETMRPDESIGLLHDLVVSIDDAAERFGVEKVKTVGTSYMAVCGLSIRRPDHTNRMVDFACEILRILRRFNQERGLDLGVQIGINAGPVVGGVVGRTKFIYDLWGDTVNVAHGMKSLGRANVICVTQTVRDRLRDLHEFASLGTVDVRGKGAIATWTVAE